MVNLQIGCSLCRHNADFFCEFTLQSLPWGFPGLQLTTWKFPVILQVFTFLALRDQEFMLTGLWIALLPDNGRDNMNMILVD